MTAGSIALLLATLLCAAACAHEEQQHDDSGAIAESSTGPRATSFDGDAEYEQGLSEVLAGAPSKYAAEALTKTFKLGYAIGRLEGDRVSAREEGEMRNLGCLAIAPTLLQARPETFGGPRLCESMLHDDLSDARLGGPMFAKGRLTVAQKGSETGDLAITGMLLKAYENGYAHGYARTHGSGGPNVAGMRTSARAGCMALVASEHRREPFSSDALENLSRNCRGIADEAVSRYLAELASRRQ